MASYRIRCLFAEATDAVDPGFLEALEVIGLLYLQEANAALCFDLVPPTGIDANLSGAWASIMAERLNNIPIGWYCVAVEVTEDERTN